MLGMQELADRCEVPYSTIRVWKMRGKLPTPDSFIGESPVWHEDTICNWWDGDLPKEDTHAGSTGNTD